MVKTKLGYRLFVLNEVVIVEMAFEFLGRVVSNEEPRLVE